ncbi:MAG: glycosyltransferase [Ferruginibacter sp.]
MNPFISICIPAYKNSNYLEVLFRSIAIQTFKDFEVIVSDDSPGEDVEGICKKYASVFPLHYGRNTIPKMSPANWNESIRRSSGRWIKLMHDDDWFSSDNSLASFAEAARNQQAAFIFSGFWLYENGDKKRNYIIDAFTERSLRSSPLHLFKQNYIGHPSTTLIKNIRSEWYDERIKWVVDIEFYIRCLNESDFYCLKQPLVNIGTGSEQITKQVFRKIEVEIPENIYLLNKLGTAILKNMVVYDYYWRLLRNVKIRKMKDITDHCKSMEVPAEIKAMVNFQRNISLQVLNVGLFSKTLMAIFYFRFLFLNKRNVNTSTTVKDHS